MKILRIIARLNVGGPARHVVWLTRDLTGDEFETVLIAGTVPPGEEDMSYLADESGIKPIYIAEMSRELSPKDALSLFKIYREIKRQNPDIIHTHTAKAGTVGRTAAFFYRWLTFGTCIGKPRDVRIVHTFHGHVFHSYYGKIKTSVFINIERFLARFATDRIVVISDQQFREIHEKFKIGRRGQFSIVPLGIDLRKYSATGGGRENIRAEFGAKTDDILVGFVGRLTEIKNIPLILRTAALYKKRTGKDRATFSKLKFVIVGDGHLRTELERKTADLGIADIVHFAGNRTDVEKIYPTVDIVALSSHNEGTPLSLIEAMAAGRAVISTSVGGVVDLLGGVNKKIDGFSICERGVSIMPNSAEDLLDGLLYLANNEKLRVSLGIHSKTFVDEKYSKERLVKDIKALYRGLRQ